MLEIRSKPPAPGETWSLLGAARAMKVTATHLVRHLVGVVTRRRTRATLNAPEERPYYGNRTGLRHRLTTKPDGTPRCVACDLCSIACPTNAIKVEAKEEQDSNETRSPALFVLDELRCVFCGFCVSVCPKDALRMDSVSQPVIASTREESLRPLQDLLAQLPRDNAYHGNKERDALTKHNLL